MNNFVDLIKSLIRPFIIVWGFLVYGICIILQVEIPLLLSGLITAVILEYFSERAILRFKE
jgi:hypothetical protein